jgi:monomeric sarcosine oxidase
MQPKNQFDVIVLGGGIAGASAAKTLAQRGTRTLLIDQFEPGHDRGSSHGDGRIIRLAYPESVYLEMARLAYRGWEALATEAGEPFVKICGGLDCGNRGSPALTELAENFERHDVPYQQLSAAESNRRFPYFHLPEGSEAIFQADAGVVFATPAVKALWRLAGQFGAKTVTGQPIERIEADSAFVEVRSASGQSWRASKLVIAAGGWTSKLLAQLDLRIPLTVTQEQVTYFPVTGDFSHRAGDMPVLIDHHAPDHFYVLPQIDIPGVKIGWHHAGGVVDPDHRQPVDTQNVAHTQAFARRRFPHLAADSPFDVTRCLYTSTPDHHFVLDRHPALPNVTIGAGFSGHGFKFGPALGEILAALATDQTPPLALDTFAIERFAAGNPPTKRTGV